VAWLCKRCGNVNPQGSSACTECGTQEGETNYSQFGLQPVHPNLIWLATLFGGVLGGYAVALWNAYLVKPATFHRLVLAYFPLALIGWGLTIFLLAKLILAFGLILGVALGFLLVSIPYNHDRLAVLQWIWAHPTRKLVLQVTQTKLTFGYVPFVAGTGSLVSEAIPTTRGLITVPVVPIAVIVVSAVLGGITLLVGRLL
jgi:hypothetical protein